MCLWAFSYPFSLIVGIWLLILRNGSLATVQHIYEFQTTVENGAYTFP